MGLRRFSLSGGVLYLATGLMTVWSEMACSGNRQQGYSPSFEATGVSRKVLTLGVPGQSFYESTDLIVNYLNDHLDSVKIQTVACNGLDDYEEKLRNAYFDLTVINGEQLLGAQRNGYRVVGQIAEVPKTVIFVNKDSGIHRFSEVAGHTISLAGKNNFSGMIMPLMFLHRQGIDVNGGLRRRYAPSFESAILDVYLGHSSMGAAFKPAWVTFLKQRPEIGGKVEARWETESPVNAGLLLKVTIDSGLAVRLAELFFRMKTDEQGRRALQRLNISGFEPADSSSFRPVEAFLREYHSVIH